MSNGEPCVPSSGDSGLSGGYQFTVWQQPGDSNEGILIELGCTSDPEAYVLALQFLRMVSFKVSTAHLKDWQGQSMMYYTPKVGWYFGTDRDLVIP